MRLSDIKGDAAIDAVAELIPPVARIARDGKVRELFEQKKVPDGMTAIEFFLSRVEGGASVLLADHKSDVIMILAALSGKTVEQYTEGLTFASLLNDLLELLNDEVFGDFLPSSGTSEEGSASTDS